MSENRMLLDEIRELKRRLQALETRQEHPGFAASDVARLSVANTFAGVQTIPNTGLHILDTNATHDLIIAPGSNLTADRTLTLTTGDADRTVTLGGNLTVNTATTITAAAATVLDDTTVAAMLATLLGTGSTLAGIFGAGQVQIDKATNGTVLLTRESADVGAPTFEFLKRRTAWGVVSSGDRLGTIGWSGADSVDAANAAQIYVEVDGTPGSNDMPGRIVFAVSPDGSGSAATAMTIKSNGSILAGTTTDNGGKLQIDQSSTTAAIPALRLNQADISEGFLDFIGTSEASAAGPISSWKVATLAGYVRCEINGAAYWMPYYNAPTAP